MTLVETSVKYFNPPADGSKPYLRAAANVAPVGTHRRNWEPISYTIQAQNIRGQEASSEHKLDTTPIEDHAPFTIKYLNRDDEALAFKYSSEHKWKYLAGMTPEEFVLFKCFDSLQDQATAAFAPHTAIDDSTVPSDAPDRQSIEIYALVFYG
ncbi:hypothetical protein RhiXN_07443 [Rhizoctonia solani]|uniref:Uncharacterized protein n=1 Tax=Rhizoctonia solani TaxID=456999 RepID=A0A8H8T1M0_9AGAM|nr:uncharacterized protein RhiXN_07443 [Rhizoctonia solani]QRW25494.1 hypothetical protein RhiXN_07443 [Rhizoctonia solani]